MTIYSVTFRDESGRVWRELFEFMTTRELRIAQLALDASVVERGTV